MSVKTTPQQVDQWRSAPTETEVLEFKEGKNQFNSQNLLEYCIAISNEGGGHLILGVKNKPPRDVVGTNAFNNLVDLTHKLYQRLTFRVDIDEVPHPSGRVLVFRIPGRPRGNPYQLDGRFLMRCGESLTAMSTDQIRRILEEGKPDWLNEHSIIGDLSSDAVVSLLDTQIYYERLGLPYPSTRESVLERFQSEGLITAVDGKYRIKRLGAILFAKRLDEFPDVKRKAPRLVVYAGADKLSTKLSQIGNRGYAGGYQGLVNFTMSQLPQNEVIENTLRKSVKMVPDLVIRELVANALIHQDFNVEGASVVIEVFEKRIDISNPGQPVVSPERFIDEYRSRNEKLADLMRRMKACEEQGLGIDRVINRIEVMQLPAPAFRFDDIRTTVSIFAYKPFAAMTRDDRIRACYQHCALKYVNDVRMTNESLRERFKLSESQGATASQIIAATVEAGLIKLDPNIGGSKRYSRYEPYWA